MGKNLKINNFTAEALEETWQSIVDNNVDLESLQCSAEKRKEIHDRIKALQVQSQSCVSMPSFATMYWLLKTDLASFLTLTLMNNNSRCSSRLHRSFRYTLF